MIPWRLKPNETHKVIKAAESGCSMGSSMVGDLADPFPVIPLRSKDAGEEVKLRMHETWLGVVHGLLKMDLLLCFELF